MLDPEEVRSKVEAEALRALILSTDPSYAWKSGVDRAAAHVRAILAFVQSDVPLINCPGISGRCRLPMTPAAWQILRYCPRCEHPAPKPAEDQPQDQPQEEGAAPPLPPAQH